MYGHIILDAIQKEEDKLRLEEGVLNEATYIGRGMYIAPYVVDNETYGKDAYFKVFDAEKVKSAKKVARIYLYRPDYAPKHEHDNQGKELCVLNSGERKELMKALQSKPSTSSDVKGSGDTVYDSMVNELRMRDKALKEEFVPKSMPDFKSGLEGKKYVK